ncbi:hypothetical protein VNO80_20328 [Phaseolus coccineus]|uniref:Uncharacterized protein n=1 Tax=Phaseolus coccineus TaxID=3886 RepID=A0AAN9MHJ9_PHACN
MEEGARLGAYHNNNEVGDGIMQCIHHHHLTNNLNSSNPGAICAFCLQEKLDKLLSSSFPSPPPPSSSSPSESPSFTPPPPPSSSLPLSLKTNHHTRSRIPFLVPNKSISTKNKKPSTTSNSSSSGNIIFKRSKSTVTSTRSHSQFIHHHHDFSPRKKNGFWSFLYPSSKEAKSPNGKQRDKCLGHTQRKSDHVIMEEDTCFSSSSSKVSRSRSVGCGSRSFSADFFERISSGLSDCTLRRVESQREGKPKVVASASTTSSAGAGVGNHCMKERVRCGGIFGGFAATSSSFSASSSSWVSSTVDDGRGRSWGWAFASPIRAFTTKASSSKRDASDKNATPNLSSIPSLLTVRG